MPQDADMPPAEQVERQWSWLLQESGLRDGVPEMIRAAFARPELRRLFPFLSLGSRLRFSRTTREPYAWDYPYALHVDGSNYQARAADNRPLAEGTLTEALDAVIATLRRPPEPVTDDRPGNLGDAAE